ncbi:MAG: ATP-binding protein [Planctomycetaceae bacterium]|nr:ATP-binding protein [Planctomycetaceae bacterium]
MTELNHIDGDASSEADALDASGHARPGMLALGKVAAPPNKESTSEFFYFWVERDKLVERTQIVTTSSVLRKGDKPVEFVGLVEEVYRQSRQQDMGEEVDRFDADTRVKPPFESAGFTYAKVTILRTDPVTHAPPTEESTVYLGGEREAARGYGIDRMSKPLKLGLLRNGGTPFAGPATIDLDYLLGENGGHLNVNGIAGLGAKTSFLLHVNAMLLREAERQKAELGVSYPGLLQVVPIIFNVKNYDLFFIDHWGKGWQNEKDRAKPEWNDYLGIADPTPFRDVEFYAPREKSGSTVNVGRTDGKVKGYSWSLSDVIEQRLFKFLFAEEDIYDANFGGLVGELEESLTNEMSGKTQLNTHGGETATFAKLLDWFRGPGRDTFTDAVGGTKGKLLRRLKYIVNEGDVVLRKDDPKGNPLVLPQVGVSGPVVIDLYGIRLAPSLQRFVVAAVFHQLIQNRSGTKSVDGLRYIVTLDELNKFAPKTGSDPITRKIEEVAAEMRSQGVILLGAQQQASLVSPRVIENASIRAVGRSGSLELSAEVWKFLGSSGRSQAAQIQADEKLLVQPSFRAPMLAKIPYPPWALKKEDAALPYSSGGPAGSGTPSARKPPVDAEFA